MKNLAFIFFLLLFSLTAHSQYESAFGDSTTSWNVADGYIDGVVTDSIATIGDTVINNLNYKKLVWYEALIPSAKYFYLREDTTKGKIWYLADTSTAEILVSDLTLEEGDIFQYPSLYGLQQTEVDTVFFEDGLKHVRFYYITFDFVRLEFVEGAVSNGGPIWFPMDETIGALLLCQHKDGVQVYQRDEYPYEGICNIIDVGVDHNIRKESYRLYPNPGSTSMRIKLSTEAEKPYQLTFSDLWGRTVKEVANYTSEEPIDISALPAGIYWISGWMNDHHNLFRETYVKQ